MNRLSVLLLIIICQSCCLYKHLPSETYTNVRDSVNVIIRDSINWIPKEKIVDVVAQYDTLNLETSLAFAQSYVDTTTHTLKGKIENKKGVESKFKEKIVYRERRDTLWREKEVPVEVVKEKKVVPKWCWRLLVFDVVLLLVFAVWIYLKFSKVDIRSLLKKI